MPLAALALCAALFAAAVALGLRSRGLQQRLARSDESLALAQQELAEAGRLLAAVGAERAVLHSTVRDREARLVELREEQRAREAQGAAAIESLRAEVAAGAQALARAQSELAAIAARAQAETEQSAERLAFLSSTEQRLRESFQSLSGAVLEKSQEQLLQVAEARFAQLQEGSRGDLAQQKQAIDQLVAPVRTQLEQVGKRLQEMEVARTGAYEGLSQQVRSLAETQGALRSETQRLVSALRAPQTRGRWAEIHLRRVVELAGLQDQCDFVEQASVTTEEGTLRPDMVIKMPGGSQVVIDAKAPLAAWLDAHESGGPLLLDEMQRKELYKNHARQVRTHVEQLSRKSYWSQFERTPDFVVLFLPTEAVLGAALEADPELHEAAMVQRVVLATPMTLIALLRTVAYGWRQDALASSARKISEEANELYKRLALLAGHFGNVGKRLKGAVEAYNDALGSLELRVLPAARKFKEYRAVPQEAELPLLAEIEAAPRTVQAPELLGQLIPESAN